MSNANIVIYGLERNKWKLKVFWWNKSAILVNWCNFRWTAVGSEPEIAPMNKYGDLLNQKKFNLNIYLQLIVYFMHWHLSCLMYSISTWLCFDFALSVCSFFHFPSTCQRVYTYWKSALHLDYFHQTTLQKELKQNNCN